MGTTMPDTKFGSTILTVRGHLSGIRTVHSGSAPSRLRGLTVLGGPEDSTQPGQTRTRDWVISVRKDPVGRRRFILARATGSGHISISELAGQLDVSMETVRRDLAIMEANGLMHRTRGGAYPARNDRVRASAGHSESDPDADRIATVAAEKISGAHTVYLDEGPVIQEVASRIAERRLGDLIAIPDPLTVITPSLTAARLLAPAPGVAVIMLGGKVQPDLLATVDYSTLKPMADMTIDIAVMGSCGVSIDGGATTEDPDVSATKSHVMSLARQSCLLVRQSDFGKVSEFRFAEIGDFDLLITDSSVLSHEAKQLAALGPRVIRV